MGRLIGALDALRLITNGPAPPSRGVSGRGASKSSTLKCQLSRVDGELIGAAIHAFPMNDSGVPGILAKGGGRNSDGRRFAATKNVKALYVKERTAASPSS
jgi:hypothetical protein